MSSPPLGICVCTSGLHVLSQSLFKEVSRQWFGCWAHRPVRKTRHIPVQSPRLFAIMWLSVLFCWVRGLPRSILGLLLYYFCGVVFKGPHFGWRMPHIGECPATVCSGFITWKGCLVGAQAALPFFTMPLVRGTQLSSNFIS